MRISDWSSDVCSSDLITEIADAKAEIFEGMDANGTAVLNRDNALFHHLCTRAEDAGVTRILSFGRHKEADARLLDCSLHATSSAVTASVRGKERRVGKECVSTCSSRCSP